MTEPWKLITVTWGLPKYTHTLLTQNIMMLVRDSFLTCQKFRKLFVLSYVKCPRVLWKVRYSIWLSVVHKKHTAYLIFWERKLRLPFLHLVPFEPIYSTMIWLDEWLSWCGDETAIMWWSIGGEIYMFSVTQRLWVLFCFSPVQHQRSGTWSCKLSLFTGTLYPCTALLSHKVMSA